MGPVWFMHFLPSSHQVVPASMQMAGDNGGGACLCRVTTFSAVLIEMVSVCPCLMNWPFSLQGALSQDIFGGFLRNPWATWHCKFDLSLSSLPSTVRLSLSLWSSHSKDYCPMLGFWGEKWLTPLCLLSDPQKAQVSDKWLPS